MVMLGVGRYRCHAVVEVAHIAGWQEGRYIAVEGIGLGVVVLRKVTVGKEDKFAAVDLGYEVEVHKAAAEVEGILVVGGTDCVKELRTLVVEVVDSHGCIGPALHILHAAAVATEAGDLARL